MALPSNADIPHILARIRPNAQWGWKGGAYNDPTNLEWRDPVQIEPTIAELEAEWTSIAANNTSATTIRQQLKTAYLPLVGRQISALTNAEQRLLLEILVYIMGGIGEDTRNLKAANQWEAAKNILSE